MATDRPIANDLMVLLKTFVPRLSNSPGIFEDRAELLLDIEQLANLIETELVLDTVDFHLLRAARSLLQHNHPVAALEKLEKILLPRCVADGSP